MRRWFLLVLIAASACTPAEVDEPPVAEPEPTFCAANGWTERPYVRDGVYGNKRGDLAGDFIVPTRDGDWRLRDEWSGCDSYVFVSDRYTVSPLDNTSLLTFDDDLDELLTNSPPNVHWFFVKDSGDEAATDAWGEDLQARLQGVLDGRDDGDWWQDRVHVLTRSVDELEGYVDNAIDSGTPGFAIDRFQRIRHIGSLADVERYSPALNNAGYWPWPNNVAYIGYEPQYYNYESDRQDELDAVDWDVHYVWYDEPITATGRSSSTIELPDAATMARYDTFLVDLRHICDPTLQEQGNCDAWDAGNRLHLCDADDPTVCDDLVSRWITTYHREGRWLVDATEALPRLLGGGEHTFRYVGARVGHFISVRFLFANTGKGATPYAMQPMFEGGGWNADYDDARGPMTFDVPADATRVHLSVTVTGHGQGGEFNCAEFCNHTHTFTVGGEAYVAEHPDMGDQKGCLNQIDQGTVPNQFGTWWFERSSWCPGKQVDPWVFDITDQVTPGQTATMEYDTNYGEPFVGGNINLQTWITYWK